MLDLSRARQFQFVGGNLALDFCNTMGGKRGGETRDHLLECGDYISWCHQAGLLGPEVARAFLVRADRSPAEAAEALNAAKTLREVIFRIFEAVVKEQPPRQSDVAAVNAGLAGALGQHRIAASKDRPGFGWEWAIREGEFADLSGPIAHAAATLLTDEKSLAQVRMCGGDNCGWLFLDSSKNHSRRWCDMRDCGNRAKIRRHRLKQQQEKRAEPY